MEDRYTLMRPASQVLDQAAHALKRSPHFALRKLSVGGNDGTLIITGKVSSYYHKQLAQEILKPLRGHLQLVNQVYVEAS